MLKLLLLNGLIIGGIYGLISLGYSLIYKASGLMSFCQGDMITVGAYLGITFYSILGLPFWIAAILSFACSFALGLLFERGVIRVMMKKNVTAMYVVLATIAVSYIIQNLAQSIYGADTIPFPQIFETSTTTFFGITAQPEAYLCIIVSFVLMILLHFFMTKTNFGIAMRGSAMDKLAAESCGINTSLCTGVAWGLAGGIAGIAGMVIGPIYGVYTLLGATIGRKGFASAVMGGYGNMYGAMIGGLILGIIETLIAGYIGGIYKNYIAYIVLLVFLFIKPTGIFNERAIKDV